MAIETRIAGLDWDRIAREIDERGWATTGPLLTDDERTGLAAAYDDDPLYRSRVVMARHGFGQGEYRYFAYPLPPLIHQLRLCLYERLVPLANRWRNALGGVEPFPDSFEEYILRCHVAGQTRPTPLILRYGAGDWNALHQDLYGDVSFPFQVLTVLSEPGVDYEGGEFVLMEQRPRAQSRAHVVTAARGAFVVFPTHHRPQQGTRGYYKVGLRHGVSTITSGSRTALGIIFHDAR